MSDRTTWGTSSLGILMVLSLSLRYYLDTQDPEYGRDPLTTPKETFSERTMDLLLTGLVGPSTSQSFPDVLQDIITFRARVVLWVPFQRETGCLRGSNEVPGNSKWSFSTDLLPLSSFRPRPSTVRDSPK